MQCELNVQNQSSWTKTMILTWKFYMNNSDLKLLFLKFSDPFAKNPYIGSLKLQEKLLEILLKLFQKYPEQNILQGNWGYVTLCLGIQNIHGDFIYRQFLNLIDSQYLIDWVENKLIPKETFLNYLRNQRELYLYQPNFLEEKTLISEFNIPIEQYKNHLKFLTGNTKSLPRDQLDSNQQIDQEGFKEKIFFSKPIFDQDFESQPEVPKEASVNFSEYQSIDLGNNTYKPYQTEVNQINEAQINQDTLGKDNISEGSINNIPKKIDFSNIKKRIKPIKVAKRKIKYANDIHSSVREFQQRMLHLNHIKEPEIGWKSKEVQINRQNFNQSQLEKFFMFEKAQQYFINAKQFYMKDDNGGKKKLGKRRQYNKINDYKPPKPNDSKVKFKKVVPDKSYLSGFSVRLGLNFKKKDRVITEDLEYKMNHFSLNKQNQQTTVKEYSQQRVQNNQKIEEEIKNEVPLQNKVYFNDEKYRKQLRVTMDIMDQHKYNTESLISDRWKNEILKIKDQRIKSQENWSIPFMAQDYVFIKEMRKLIKEINSELIQLIENNEISLNIKQLLKKMENIQKNFTKSQIFRQIEGQYSGVDMMKKILKITTLQRVDLHVDYLIQYLWIYLTKQPNVQELEDQIQEQIEIVRSLINIFQFFKRLESTQNLNQYCSFEFISQSISSQESFRNQVLRLNSKLDCLVYRIFMQQPLYKDRNQFIGVITSLLTIRQICLNITEIRKEQMIESQLLQQLRNHYIQLDKLKNQNNFDEFIKSLLQRIQKKSPLESFKKEKLSYKSFILLFLVFYTSQSEVQLINIKNLNQYVRQFTSDISDYLRGYGKVGYFWLSLTYLLFWRKNDRFSDNVQDKKNIINYQNEIQNHFDLIPKIFTLQENYISITFQMFRLLFKDEQEGKKLDQFFFLHRYLTKLLLKDQKNNYKDILRTYKRLNNKMDLNSLEEETQNKEADFIIEVLRIFQSILDEQFVSLINQSDISQSIRNFKRFQSRILPEIQIKQFDSNPLYFLQNLSLLKAFLKFQIKFQSRMGVEYIQILKLFIFSSNLKDQSQQIQLIIFRSTIDLVSYVRSTLNINQIGSNDKFEKMKETQMNLFQIIIEILSSTITQWLDSRKYLVGNIWTQKQDFLNFSDEQDEILTEIMKSLSQELQENIIFKSHILRNLDQLKIKTEKDFYVNNFQMKDATRRAIIIFVTCLIQKYQNEHLNQRINDEFDFDGIQIFLIEQKFIKESVEPFRLQLVSHLFQNFLPWCFQSFAQIIEKPAYFIQKSFIHLTLNISADIVLELVKEDLMLQYKIKIFLIDYLETKFLNGSVLYLNDYDHDQVQMKKNLKIESLTQNFYSRIFYKIIANQIWNLQNKCSMIQDLISQFIKIYSETEPNLTTLNYCLQILSKMPECEENKKISQLINIYLIL